jgi:hypothetical protein
VTRERPITKALFASGLQYAKKLYLDYHEQDDPAPPSPRRQSLAEIGLKLIELARAVFPKSERADPDDFAKACRQTAGWIKDRPHVAIFDAAFEAGDLQTRTDIVIPDGKGAVDLYEVKSGTKVKTRHLRDLAFQVHVLERCGLQARQIWVLHLNTQYRHRGGSTYPVHELLKHVDVTAKVRAQAERVEQQLADFRNILKDPSTLDLPTGTWCHVPFTCEHLERCRATGPEHPLLDLPDLTWEQESAFHQQGIEDLTQIDPEDEGLSLVQRRALRSIHSGSMVVEPFVGHELRDVDYPLHFVWATSFLQVLPVLENSYPWQHIPFLWHDLIVEEDGKTRHRSFVADGKGDPRPEFVRTLAEAVRGAGTLMVYGPALEQRLRELLEQGSEQKSDVRALLGQARFDLRQLVRVGVYHPEMRGSFRLDDVRRCLCDGLSEEDLSVQSDDDAQTAWQRLLNSRTRAATRQKVCAELEAWGKRCAESIHSIYESLLGTTQGAPVDH